MTVLNKQQNIATLIATFNGSKYIKEQMASILAQNENLKILVYDDQSTDTTKFIINKFKKKHPRVCFETHQLSNIGTCKSFSKLLKKAQEQNINVCFFSDQDDVWINKKFQKQVNLLKKTEKKHKNIPVLIYSDMEVVDTSLNTIHPSFMKYQNIHNEINKPLQVLLSQNYVAGCSMLINKPLMKIAFPFPSDAIMHDSWIALCAASMGIINYIDEPLVKYRQHHNNCVGAIHFSNFFTTNISKITQQWQQGGKNLYQSIQQAKALVQRIKEHDPNNKNLVLIESYASILQLSPWKRVQKLRNLGIHAQSKLRHALLLARLLFLPTEKR